MFSIKEKQLIAEGIEKLLLSLNHPEMPKEKPLFKIHIDGKENWSWADIGPNWIYNLSNPATTTLWNEKARDIIND